jgi:hypothetical protein
LISTQSQNLNGVLFPGSSLISNQWLWRIGGKTIRAIVGAHFSQFAALIATV